MADLARSAPAGFSSPKTKGIRGSAAPRRRPLSAGNAKKPRPRSPALSFDDDEDYPTFKPVKPKVTTFLKDADDADDVLPRPLPKGITYVSNFTTYDDLMDRNILQVDEDEKVHLSTEEVLAIYRAKCEDQGLCVSWQREARFMELISKNCKGLMFSLRENGLGYLSAQCIAEVLADNSYYALLDLSGNRLRDTGAESIAQLLEHNDTLVHLALKSNDIGHVGGGALARALETNNTLTSLDLSGISGINRNHLGTKGAMALSNALKVNRVLCILNLGSNGLGKEGMGLLVQGLMNNTTITDIDLSSNNLGWEGCQILSSVLDTANFQAVNLERNFIGDRGCNILAQVLKGPSRAATTMEALNLCHNNIRSAGYKSLAEVIRLSKTIQQLKLDGNECNDEGAIDFASSLKDNSSLTFLSLNKVDFTPEAGKALGDALVSNTALQKLELGDNCVSDLGAASLCQALKKDKVALQYLDLSNNKISDKGGVEIAAMLKVNSSLQHLTVKQNALKVTGDRIAEVLKGNRSLLSLDFTFNDFSYKSYSAIQQALQRNSKAFKATAGERLMSQIEVLKRDEELLFLTRDNIEEEMKQREVAKEKVKQKREALKKTVASLKNNLQELEEELQAKQQERQKEEELNQKLAEEVSRFKSKMDKQTTSLTKKIEAENEKMQKLTKQIATTTKAIQKLVDTEEETFAPLLEQLRHEESLRDTAKEDARWEAEKLVQWELKMKNLEKGSAAEAAPAAAAATAAAPDTDKGKAEKGKKGKKDKKK
eukprot:GGOE01014454.1.p1 GENE.GGOE01014454.1~~GGOE01014454.1.p1  ORF type:complete len:789 (-),score=351.19 GGOE01014454.1:393-2705(-)